MARSSKARCSPSTRRRETRLGRATGGSVKTSILLSIPISRTSSNLRTSMGTSLCSAATSARTRQATCRAERSPVLPPTRRGSPRGTWRPTAAQQSRTIMAQKTSRARPSRRTRRPCRIWWSIGRRLATLRRSHSRVPLVGSPPAADRSVYLTTPGEWTRYQGAEARTRAHTFCQ